MVYLEDRDDNYVLGCLSLLYAIIRNTTVDRGMLMSAGLFPFRFRKAKRLLDELIGDSDDEETDQSVVTRKRPTEGSKLKKGQKRVVRAKAAKCVECEELKEKQKKNEGEKEGPEKQEEKEKEVKKETLKEGAGGEEQETEGEKKKEKVEKVDGSEDVKKKEEEEVKEAGDGVEASSERHPQEEPGKQDKIRNVVMEWYGADVQVDGSKKQQEAAAEGYDAESGEKEPEGTKEAKGDELAEGGEGLRPG